MGGMNNVAQCEQIKDPKCLRIFVLLQLQSWDYFQFVSVHTIVCECVCVCVCV